MQMPVLRKLLYFCAVIVFCLLATELLARWKFGHVPYFSKRDVFWKVAFERFVNSNVTFAPGGRSYSPKFGWTLSPNATTTDTQPEYKYTIHTNSLGFRAREVAPRAPNEYRLLLLGDSMLFGVGVDEDRTIAACVEQIAQREAPARRVTVYDYSVPGYNTVQALQAGRAFACQASPNQIVLGVFITNDLLPNVMVYADPQGLLATDSVRVRQVEQHLRERVSILDRATFTRILALAAYVPRLRYQFSSEPDIIGHTYSLLTQCADLARSCNATLSVVVVYPRQAVAGGLVGTWSESRKPGQMIVAWCRRERIPVLDLLDVMDGEAEAKSFFFPHDGHFTAQGNARVARAVFDSLVAPAL